MNPISRTIAILKVLRERALSTIILAVVLNACTLNSSTITKDKYEQVQTGMTLAQVQNIMGKNGETTGELSFNIPGMTSSPIEGKQAVYQWKNHDGSSMTAVFINDKLILKTELNLKQ